MRVAVLKVREVLICLDILLSPLDVFKHSIDDLLALFLSWLVGLS